LNCSPHCSRRNSRDKVDQKGWAEQIVTGVKFLNTIVTNMLTFTKVSRPQFTLFDLEQMIAETLVFLEPVCVQRNIHLTQCRSEQSLLIEGDREMLRQMLINLLMNGLQAMPEQGTLAVAATSDEPGLVQIEVQDTGVGIPEENLSRIFDPFFTTNEKGTGPWTFPCPSDRPETPRHSGCGEPIRPRHAIQNQAAGKAVPGGLMLIKDVLIVDDDPQMLIAMSEAVKRNDFSVTTAGNGIQALEILKETQFRTVITDLRMPGITGLDVLREVKAESPRSQVVLVTAHGSVNNAVEAMKMGAFDYLLKPFALDDLHDVVQRALRKNESFLGRGKSQSHGPVITQNPDMLATLDLAEQAAKGRATMLIQAESGTGKELLARGFTSPVRGVTALTSRSIVQRCRRTCSKPNLFGYEKGAFTGAIGQKPGKFEMAHGGTILLDEIGEMVPMLQAKLLRVLQEQEIDRLGGRKPIPVDIRVIATTNKSLKSLVRAGAFRETFTTA
jgi:CheY-like chemotaxis protein